MSVTVQCENDHELKYQPKFTHIESCPLNEVAAKLTQSCPLNEISA